MYSYCLMVIAVFLYLDVPATTAKLVMKSRNISVLPGRNVDILCKADLPLLYCRIKLPGIDNALSLSPKTKPNKEYAYHGSGLADGECGVTLFSVGDKFSGVVECTGAPEEGTEEASDMTTLTVLRGPKAPVLVIAPSLKTHKNNAFKEDDVMQASCIVKDGRPVAGITWYLGGDVITAGIKTDITSNEKTKLHTIRQTLNRRIGWKDNGKELRCVARHEAIGTSDEAGQTFTVSYPPKGIKLPIELYEFAINKTGNVTVEIWANPKPMFTWSIGKTLLAEGQKHSSGNLEAMPAQSLEPGKWSLVLHIKKVSQEDLEVEYHLQAKNSEGQRTYIIVLSTESGPKFKFTMGMIVGGVVAVVLVLTVLISVFVYVSGRRKRTTFTPTGDGMSKVTIDS